MWSKNYPISIVVSEGSWYEPYGTDLVAALKKMGFNVNFGSSHQNIARGSIVFYLSYSKIVPEKFIKETYQSLVIHASDLPKGKGFSPWVWQILEGKDIIPVCLMRIEVSLDSGDIFQKTFLRLNGTELLHEIRENLAKVKKGLILKHLTGDKEPKAIPQKGIETHYRKRDANDSQINANLSIAEQFNLLRIVDNEKYPAYFMHNGKKYLIKVFAEEQNL